MAFQRARPVVLSTSMGESSQDSLSRRVLSVLLALNGSMFVLEIAGGWFAESMGLMADGLDMGADAAVYALALLAIGASSQRKLGAARFAGVVQFLLGIGAIVEVGRRWIVGSAPEPPAMVGISVLALVVNATCLALLRRHREGEVHLQAAWIFSATDVQANLGVIAAGLLVAWLDSPVPDLIIGAIVSALVLRGALRIRNRVRLGELAARAQER
jgi:Co/Zn/Cd efflux system component